MTSSRGGGSAVGRRAEDSAVAHESTLLGRHLGVRMQSVRRVHFQRCVVFVFVDPRLFRLPLERRAAAAVANWAGGTDEGHFQLVFDQNNSAGTCDNATAAGIGGRAAAGAAAAGTGTGAGTALVGRAAATSAPAIRFDFNLLQLSRRRLVQPQIRIQSSACV